MGPLGASNNPNCRIALRLRKPMCFVITQGSPEGEGGWGADSRWTGNQNTGVLVTMLPLPPPNKTPGFEGMEIRPVERK